MIRKIIYDIIVFLGLLFTVMTGFSFAFYVVFQAESKDEDIPLDSSFGNLGKCFETLFFSILGDFDLQVILFCLFQKGNCVVRRITTQEIWRGWLWVDSICTC